MHSQKVMIDINRFNLHKYLVAQGYDSSNNMLGKKSGVAKRILDTIPMAIESYYFSHSASLPCKAIYNDTNTFHAQIIEIISLI